MRLSDTLKRLGHPATRAFAQEKRRDFSPALATCGGGRVPVPGVVRIWPALLNLRQGEPKVAVEEQILDQVRTLDRFLVSVEKRAFRIAWIAVRHDDDALDIVQDAMLQLARRYAQRPSEEWRPLFYRILQNRVRDHQRRHKVRAKLMSWLPAWKADEDESSDPYAAVPDARPQPQELLATDQAMAKLEQALAQLPGRQQEAFMLRNFEGMDVAETASAMGCSEGSVKTHYSRAVHTLREQLGAAW
jgi:RNA polymerase sigma-70 factor (ECF subfamily)